jgi:hypothetical protein
VRAQFPFLVWLVLALASTGCAAYQSTTRHVWLPAYLFGSIGGGDLDVRDVCPSGRAEQLSVGASWRTLGVSLVTLGVYTPREAKVRCAPKR